MSVGQGTLPSSGHATGRALSRLQVLKSGQLCNSIVGTAFHSLYLQDKKQSDYSYTLQKSCEHFYQIFKVLWCLETPVEAL